MIPSLLTQMVTILSKRCSEPLRLIRSGASQVRTNTKSKTSGSNDPSYFVFNILRPIRVFLEGSGRVLEHTTQTRLVTDIFEDVAGRYEAALAKMKKDGDALRRLKKGRAGFQLFGSRSAANEDAANMSEDDKVRIQMSVDVDALATDAESLGVILDSSHALRGLRAVIEEWSR